MPAQAGPVSLRYTNDAEPGIRRRRRGRGFSYTAPDGQPVGDAETLARIRSLAIPPAWTDVWVCADPAGHVQATGRDARGRKQYRYHPGWSAARDETRHHRTIAFGRSLPKIRKAVDADLRRREMSQRKVLGVVVRLLDTTFVRIGNAEYARDNRSFGLTTLQDRHVDINGSEVSLRFRGKGGKTLQASIRDRRLARAVKRCEEIPGQDLFQYFDDEGERHTITSSQVNDYIREIAGDEFTAKDFRTWAATVLATVALAEAADEGPPTKRRANAAIESVAARLGHTRTICRNCYIHPAVLDAYSGGRLLDAFPGTARARRHMSCEEQATLRLLQALTRSRRR